MKRKGKLMKNGFRAVSLNLKTAKSADSNFQREREPLIAEFVGTALPDTLGTQECEAFWRERLDDVLAPHGYVRAQAVPSDGVTKNYMWYRPQSLELVDSGVFWLSETPDISSKGFGSRFFISCCYAEYRIRATGARFLHFNTHLNVDSEEIRRKELTVLLPRMRGLCKDRGLPAILTGDFNSEPDSEIYKSVCAELTDVRIVAPVTTAIGTFNDFCDKMPYCGIIDYCFVTEGIAAKKYAVFDKLHGKLISDHNAVILDLAVSSR